jgi:hypothetical protein
MTAAQAGEDGHIASPRLGGGLADRGLQTRTGFPQPQDPLDERDISLVVPAVTPGLPLRVREVVPVLPAAQRRGRHAGTSRQLADGQAVLRFAHHHTPLHDAELYLYMMFMLGTPGQRRRRNRRNAMTKILHQAGPR